MTYTDTAVVSGIRRKNSPAQGRPADLRLPLSRAMIGERLRVETIRGEEEPRRFLRNLGFVEGAEIAVVAELHGNVIVNIKGARMAISKAMASLIWTI